MPGALTSKGCNACRKAKKKCDELQPCSRCQRLQIPCEGSGQQRYKFQHADSSQPVQPRSRRRRSAVAVPGPKIAQQLPTDALLSCFISTLQIHDVRYAITYYGLFLHDLPRRLGQSAALDASVKSLVTSYPYFHKVHGRDFPQEVLVDYGRSLRVLRETLSDPRACHSPDTLCAIYLISVCQSWMGNSSINHGEAIAHLLRNINVKECTGKFERELIAILAVPLDGIDLLGRRGITPGTSPTVLSSKGPRSSMSLISISMLPEFMRNPDAHLPAITSLYFQLREDAQKTRSFLDQLAAEKVTTSSPLVPGPRARYQTAYVMMASLALVANALMRIFDPGNAMLMNEAAYFCDAIVDEAHLASCYRPLGSAYAALCLVVALSTADDPQRIARIESILGDYQSDFRDVRWGGRAAWLRQLFTEHRMRVALGRDVQPEVVSDLGVCCIM
ncbi:hypothetical protein N7468_005050 [Penicillium chermesinum]|uniref:Zn(2)-C6 fungal-type domain-containing protein n=1 Tax=Penicillium chermesinum TaxID=63820 RepID=A0A9W9NYG8_9EURO|nr:uncharacterized protein N7468_005050 [Penicillium chermesinum]KAJ5232094.1 hypothetical protein N7468_005050 [Penicillium chermesinum]